MARFNFEVTDDAGVKIVAKITGPPAAAALDSLTQFLATQVDTVGETPVPRYTDAADYVKKRFLRDMQDIAPKFPSTTLKADAAEIDAKIAALQAKRDALFAAAIAEK